VSADSEDEERDTYAAIVDVVVVEERGREVISVTALSACRYVRIRNVALNVGVF
jgi:hypothetical protein